MRHPRVHLPFPLQPGATFPLPEQTASHVTRVLRLTAGDAITVFDGSGTDYCARIISLERRTAIVQLGQGTRVDRESPLQVILLQGVARGPRMDTVVQKATELGIAEIRPITTDRSVVRLDEDRAASRAGHWQRIAISACEQCGRSVVPPVHTPVPIGEALQSLPFGYAGILLDPEGGRDLAGLIGSSQSVALAIGPEGGFSPADREQLGRAGFGALRLGPRTLRTETAPLVALSLLQFTRGDLGR